jgi:ABC-type bacteriocin/lantibiotic exporter with double-glycine peptidase domain
MANHFPNKREFREQFFALLNPEAGFYKVVLIYSLAISLLTLAVPISLQLLVDTVANIALVRAVVLISALLFALLMISGILYALRAYAMEVFSRKLYARISTEIAMTAMLAEPEYFGHKQKADLFNRFFDIVTLKKSIPDVLTNGFTLILQAIIGFTVVSFYHFYFFIFSILLILIIWLIWKIWGWRSIKTSFHLSESKYETVAWLQSLALNNEVYISSHKPHFGLEQTDSLIDTHIKCQSDHFRNTFSQLLGMLFLYAAASAVLLGLGGWLVIQGQLTLGQLVAAELIMSAIFVGLPQLAGYLDSFFYICAAVEELSRFRTVETEEPDKDTDVLMPSNHEVVFNKVKVEQGSQTLELNLKILNGGSFRVLGDIMCLRSVTELLRRHYRQSSGLITIGGHDTNDIQREELRRGIRVINRVRVPPLSIKEFLNLFIHPRSEYSRQQALALVQLDDEITHLENGIDTELNKGAWPLSQSQAIRLKLASVLLSEPSILILEDIVDAVESDIMDDYLKAIQQLGTTILYFTRRRDIGEFEYVLRLEANSQTVLAVNEGEK